MKNNKLQFYLKKNLISFIVGATIFSGVGAYAAVTFPSNEVSYDNTSSGLKSTNVKGAIDELYNTCFLPAGEQIINNAGLTKDQYENRYFFTGANPNNYVTFNNEQAGWRIISIEGDGTIKIVRINSILNRMEWDIFSSNNNNWARPAGLNTYLKETYYNSLNSTAKGQIVSHDWSIGAVTQNNNDLGDQVKDENSSTWNGKIALPTVSEYIRTNSNTNCNTVSKININFNTCKNSTWMSKNDYWWTLSPSSGSSNFVFFVQSIGNIAIYDAGGTIIDSVRPALYLSSNIKITGGTGTQSDPYTIQ